MFTPPKKGERRGGRQKGVPNKATTLARAAIGRFVDRNSPRMQGWLDEIARGIPRRQIRVKGEDGEWLLNPDGTPVLETEWIVPPDPKKAFELLAAVIEYHVPKLNRTELSGSLEVTKDTEEMSDDELLSLIAQQTRTVERAPGAGLPELAPPDPSKVN